MRYLWGPTGILARQTSGGTVSWYLADQLGTVRDLVNNSGQIIDHVDFSAYGTVRDESSPSNGDRFVGFAGLVRDTVTGLNLAVEWEENPGTGRWDSQDPLVFGAGDSDLYRYVTNRPTNHDDSGGLEDEPGIELWPIQVSPANGPLLPGPFGFDPGGNLAYPVFYPTGNELRDPMLYAQIDTANKGGKEEQGTPSQEKVSAKKR
jgi:RHS repeat-associated protein